MHIFECTNETSECILVLIIQPSWEPLICRLSLPVVCCPLLSLLLISVLLEEWKEWLVSICQALCWSGSSSSLSAEGERRILPLLLVFVHQLLIDYSVHVILIEREREKRTHHSALHSHTLSEHWAVSEDDEHEHWLYNVCSETQLKSLPSK